jgi:uncharacterized protein (TIGR02452 family)
MIYSPGVPFFRDDEHNLLTSPFVADVITAPAPNVSGLFKRVLDLEPLLVLKNTVGETIWRRAGYVLAVARDKGIRHLVLGAWGCGVFGNDPYQVAEAFRTWLHSAEFSEAFDTVTFAMYGDGTNFETFREVFHETTEF